MRGKRACRAEAIVSTRAHELDSPPPRPCPGAWLYQNLGHEVGRQNMHSEAPHTFRHVLLRTRSSLPDISSLPQLLLLACRVLWRGVHATAILVGQSAHSRPRPTSALSEHPRPRLRTPPLPFPRCDAAGGRGHTRRSKRSVLPPPAPRSAESLCTFRHQALRAQTCQRLHLLLGAA